MRRVSSKPWTPPLIREFPMPSPSTLLTTYNSRKYPWDLEKFWNLALYRGLCTWKIITFFLLTRNMWAINMEEYARNMKKYVGNMMKYCMWKVWRNMGKMEICGEYEDVCGIIYEGICGKYEAICRKYVENLWKIPSFPLLWTQPVGEAPSAARCEASLFQLWWDLNKFRAFP